VAPKKDRRPAGRPRPGPALTLGVFVVIGVAIGTAIAVGQRPAPTPSPTRFVPPTGTAGALPPPVTGKPSSASGGQPSASGSVRIDPSLLAQLPSTVGGIALVEDADTESHDAADPAHAADLAGLAVAIAADPSTPDLAVASVVRLKPGIYSDEYFRSWRETFDTGACSQAGGVAGSAESVIAGRRTFIGHCAGGVFTYHVYLPAGAAIVSISSLGARRLGELIMQGIR
jgi:hypothetical protein